MPHHRRERRRCRPVGGGEVERPGQLGAQLLERDSGVQTVDGLHAELIGHELTDERQRQLGRPAVGSASVAQLVAVDPLTP